MLTRGSELSVGLRFTITPVWPVIICMGVVGENDIHYNWADCRGLLIEYLYSGEGLIAKT